MNDEVEGEEINIKSSRAQSLAKIDAKIEVNLEAEKFTCEPKTSNRIDGEAKNSDKGGRKYQKQGETDSVNLTGEKKNDHFDGSNKSKCDKDDDDDDDDRMKLQIAPTSGSQDPQARKLEPSGNLGDEVSAGQLEQQQHQESDSNMRKEADIEAEIMTRTTDGK